MVILSNIKLIKRRESWRKQNHLHKRGSRSEGREKIKQFKINISKVITDEAWKHFPELSKLELEKVRAFPGDS